MYSRRFGRLYSKKRLSRQILDYLRVKGEIKIEEFVSYLQRRFDASDEIIYPLIEQLDKLEKEGYIDMNGGELIIPKPKLFKASFTEDFEKILTLGHLIEFVFHYIRERGSASCNEIFSHLLERGMGTVFYSPTPNRIAYCIRHLAKKGIVTFDEKTGKTTHTMKVIPLKPIKETIATDTITRKDWI